MKFTIYVFSMLALVSFAFGQQKKSESMKLYVSGMHCDNCVQEVSDALKAVKGVSSVKVDLKAQTADILLASNTVVKTDALVKAVTDAGFTASTTKPKAGTVLPAKPHHEGGESCDSDSSDCCKTKESKKETKKS